MNSIGKPNFSRDQDFGPASERRAGDVCRVATMLVLSLIGLVGLPPLADPAAAMAQDDVAEPADDRPAASNVAPESIAPAPDPERKEQIRQTLDLGMLLLVIIVLIAIFLMAMIMVGGRFVRRMGRTEVRSPQPTDPLWHLRKPRKPEESSNPGPPSSE